MSTTFNMAAGNGAAASRWVVPIAGDSLTLVRKGRTLLDRVTLEIDGRGAVPTIIGPNGAGKSVLIRVLAGLIAADSGRVLWAGLSPDRDRARHVGFVFQRPVMLRRSALANMTYPLMASGIARDTAERDARAALDEAGLGHLIDTPARQLSGGEQQRVALARALLLKPGVMFLDEPTANLDPSSTAAIEARIKAAAEAGLHVVLVTQDLKQARRLATEIILMHQGQLLEKTPAKSFFERPKTPEAQRFLDGQLLL